MKERDDPRFFDEHAPAAVLHKWLRNMEIKFDNWWQTAELQLRNFFLSLNNQSPVKEKIVIKEKPPQVTVEDLSPAVPKVETWEVAIKLGGYDKNADTSEKLLKKMGFKIIGKADDHFFTVVPPIGLAFEQQTKSILNDRIVYRLTKVTPQVTKDGSTEFIHEHLLTQIAFCKNDKVEAAFLTKAMI